MTYPVVKHLDGTTKLQLVHQQGWDLMGYHRIGWDLIFGKMETKDWCAEPNRERNSALKSAASGFLVRSSAGYCDTFPIIQAAPMK